MISLLSGISSFKQLMGSTWSTSTNILGSAGSLMGGMRGAPGLMLANRLSPGLTGRELDEYAANPAGIFDPGMQAGTGERIISRLNEAPRKAWGGVVKASLMLHTVPRLARLAAGVSPPTRPIVPMGLRRLLGPNAGRSWLGRRATSLWGFGAGTIATGSPIGGLFTAGTFQRFAEGNLFGRQLGAGGGGLLGLIADTKAGGRISKTFREMLGPLDVGLTGKVTHERTGIFVSSIRNKMPTATGYNEYIRRQIRERVRPTRGHIIPNIDIKDINMSREMANSSVRQVVKP